MVFFGNDAQTAASYPAQSWYHVAETYGGTNQDVYIDDSLALARTGGALAIADTSVLIGVAPFGQAR